MIAQIIDLGFSNEDWYLFFFIMAGLMLAIVIYYQS